MGIHLDKWKADYLLGLHGMQYFQKKGATIPPVSLHQTELEAEGEASQPTAECAGYTY